MKAMRRVAFRLVLVCLPIIAGCTGDPTSERDKLAAAPASGAPVENALRELSCADGFQLDAPAGRLTNNVWNKQAIGEAPYRQCILARGVGDAEQYGWSWSWPAESRTFLSYPQVVFGWKPWDGGASTTADLPIRIDAIDTLRLAYAFDTRAQGRHNLAVAMWLTRSGRTMPEPNAADIGADINIWTDGLDIVPSAARIDAIEIDGASYEVWYAPDMGDASGASGNRWQHIVYRATERKPSASLDLRQFLSDALARGWIAPTHHVSSVEIGNEVMNGAGETWIEELVLEIARRPGEPRI